MSAANIAAMSAITAAAALYLHEQKRREDEDGDEAFVSTGAHSDDFVKSNRRFWTVVLIFIGLFAGCVAMAILTGGH